MEERKVLIRRQGAMIRVIPDYHLILAPHLVYSRRKQTAGNEFKYEKTAMYKWSENTLFVPAGLTTRVINILRSEGREVVLEDLRPKVLPDPDLTKLDPLRPIQDDLLVAVMSNDWGIIEGPTGFGKSFMICQLCKIWSTANIIIASPFTGLINQVYKELLEMFSIHEVGMMGGGRHRNRRITCCVDRSLLHCDLEHCQLFIFDEVHRAAAPQTSEAIGKIMNARRFGFSASPSGRSDNADLETEGLFGPVIFKTTYQDVQATGHIVPIKVMMINTDGFTAVDYENPVVLERRGLWRNIERNKLIAQTVKWALAEFGQDSQTLIAVKTLDHLVHLGAELNREGLGFTLMYGSMEPERRQKYENWGLIEQGKHPLTGQEKERIQEDFTSGKLRRVIATANSSGVWGTGMNFPHLEILVRADGQSGAILNTQISGRVSRKPNSATGDEKCEGILIDFADTFSKILQGRATRRMGLYRKKGWQIKQLSLPTVSVTI